MLQIKRLLDVVFGVLGIVLLFPLWVIISCLIKLCVHGSVLFRQERVGYGGTRFEILKFRTIHEDEQAHASTTQGPWVGRVMRRMKLDELPQLINVVKGEMSFVGPRPYIARESEGLPEERYKMRPGMTGLAQVNGNRELNWEERTAYDLYYVENYTLWMDFHIVLQTVKVILIGEKACIRHANDWIGNKYKSWK